jgi:hypothetical protein
MILCESAECGSADGAAAPAEGFGHCEAGDVSRASVLSAAAEALLVSANPADSDIIAIARAPPPHALHDRLFVVPTAAELAAEADPTLHQFGTFWARWVDAVNNVLTSALARGDSHGSNTILTHDVCDVLDRRFVLACVTSSRRDVVSPKLWTDLTDRARKLREAQASEMQFDHELLATTFVYSVVGPEVLRQYGFDLADMIAADAVPLSDAKDWQQRANVAADDAEKAVAEAAARVSVIQTAFEEDWENDADADEGSGEPSEIQSQLDSAKAELKRLCVESERAKNDLEAATAAVSHPTTRAGNDEAPTIRPTVHFAARGAFQGDKWVDTRSKGGCKEHDGYFATCKWCCERKEKEDRNKQTLAGFVTKRVGLVGAAQSMSRPKRMLFDPNKPDSSCVQLELELRMINDHFKKIKRGTQPERPVSLTLEAWVAALGDFADRVDGFADKIDRFADTLDPHCTCATDATVDKVGLGAVRDKQVKEAVEVVKKHLESCNVCKQAKPDGGCGAPRADHKLSAAYVAPHSQLYYNCDATQCEHPQDLCQHMTG